jgi:hypothetical protein
MSHNDDFSFVRFLKVVKTLYESSTFTQLGRTVGTALGYSAGATKFADDDDETTTSQRSKDEAIEKRHAELQTAKESSIFSLLQACTTLPQDDLSRMGSSDSKRKDNQDMATIDTRDTMKASVSLLEQVINCAFAQDGGEPYSDDDTYHSKGSYDDDQTLGDSTFSEDSGRRDIRGRSRRRRQKR